MSIVRTALRSLFSAANVGCRPLGFEIKPINRPLRSFKPFFQFIQRQGFDVSSVFDVGVGYGTPSLYESFSDKKIILVEPLPVYQKTIAEVKKRYDADVFQVAASNEDGEIEFIVESEFLERSSVLSRSELTRVSTGDSKIRVATMKLDSIVAQSEYKAPYLLKVDTEGFELSVLQGATEMLKQTELVVLETSVASRFEGGYETFDLLKLMDENGFALFDILGGSNNKHGMLNCIDTAFVPKNSPLRRAGTFS